MPQFAVALTTRVSRGADSPGRPLGDLLCFRHAAAAWRGDGVERGYSMALSRVGDPQDGDCVLVTARVNDRLCGLLHFCLLYTSPSPRDGLLSRMPSSA